MVPEMRDVCLSVCVVRFRGVGFVCVCVCWCVCVGVCVGGELGEGRCKGRGWDGMGWMDEKGKNNNRDISESIYIFCVMLGD